MLTISLTHYVVLSALLFSIGLFGVLTKRNAVAVLICIELMLNAVNINLVAFSLRPAYCHPQRRTEAGLDQRRTGT